MVASSHAGVHLSEVEGKGGVAPRNAEESRNLTLLPHGRSPGTAASRHRVAEPESDDVLVLTHIQAAPRGGTAHFPFAGAGTASLGGPIAELT
eukprot:SAG22_NODE_9707_length_574_cov_0.926316_1_plen_92_part_10